MIAGIFHQGSGLGNQLHRYVATRVVAEDTGHRFGMMNPDYFKGDSFMDIDKGQSVGEYEGSGQGRIYKLFTPMNKWVEKEVRDADSVDIRGYDPEFNFIGDNMVIDGEFQDERYFGHRLTDVNQWLAVESLDIPDDTCVIGFRGGEYTVFPDLFLTRDYWNDGIGVMKERGITRFEVHTDDAITASKVFPDYTIVHHIGINWRSMRYAKHAIIANSSFYILPRLLHHHLSDEAVTIAPRYWARRNTQTWALPQNYYKGFKYI